MKVLDLFSGIGGFSLGLERAGMETVAFCEFDEKCRQVLKKHWPDVPQYHDVRTLTAEQLEHDGIKDIGLVCGGYPCQPFSTAGKREGENDDRHLWPEIKRLLTEYIEIGKPVPRCLFENVAGHVTLGLDSVLADLETLGYACWPLIIPACAVGAYHRRDRIWIIAHSDSAADGEQHVNEGARNDHQGALSDVPNANSERLQGRIHIRSPDAEGWEEQENRSLGSCGNGWSWDRPVRWEPEPRVGRVANGIPGRVDRLKQLGNAVVPQVAEMLGHAIMESANES